ncbi:MAG: Ni/Fe hydrogenase subunit alpha [Gammaproteobacteria bacterium]|nr:Ni/Fe hydrogenase subunit alpha [Gammaproteobacteria bacterium]MBT8150205.1 Ni/Fe hydrogenase subunit alpha [Gammaproteobacteria bacterium]
MNDPSKVNLKRVVIDPVTRVEGHGKVSLLLDDDNQIHEARFHIVEFRGFERFIEGRPYWELPMVVQRLCGICPVSHHLAAGKAIDQLAGVSELSPPAEKLRRLLHWGQSLQSHALHFFHLASPDLLFGFESDVRKRSIVSVIESHRDLALKGVKIRKYGQEVIKAITGKKIHGMAVLAGGMNRALTTDQIKQLKIDIKDIINWTEEALVLVRKLYLSDIALHTKFAKADSAFLSLVDKDGTLDLYHGGLRIKNTDGSILHDHYDYSNYTQLIKEQVKSWSYMKFPFLIERGPQTGWYKVGPLARINNCDRIDTIKAESYRQDFLAHSEDALVHPPLAFHWARMIEALYCAEAIAKMLDDPDLCSGDLMRRGEKQLEGIGVIEAPRGTLFHHYKINENDQVTMANLIVSTTSNNQAMNESVRQVANTYVSGRELTPELLNNIEVAIRAYDPCLSCATHAVGKMPLQVELLNSVGETVARCSRSSETGFNVE